MGTIITAIALIGIVSFIIKGMYSDKKNGKAHCGGSCKDCGGSCH